MTIAPKLSRGVRAVLFGATAVAVLLLLLGYYDASVAVGAAMAEPTPFTAEYYAAPSERFGVGITTKVSVPDDDTMRPAQISISAGTLIGRRALTRCAQVG